MIAVLVNRWWLIALTLAGGAGRTDHRFDKDGLGFLMFTSQDSLGIFKPFLELLIRTSVNITKHTLCLRTFM